MYELKLHRVYLFWALQNYYNGSCLLYVYLSALTLYNIFIKIALIPKINNVAFSIHKHWYEIPYKWVIFSVISLPYLISIILLIINNIFFQ